MGIRSDVAVVLTKELLEEAIKNQEIRKLFTRADHTEEEEGQVLIVLTNVKFHLMEGNEFYDLFQLAKDRLDEMYVLEVCAEYSQTEEYGDLDPVFDLGYSMVLTY